MNFSSTPHQEPEPEVLNIRHESSVQVGIPVLADVDTPIPAPTSVPELGQLPHSASLPTISITRPPVPLPVELPQPIDILPESTPASPISSFDEDLESGRSLGMRQVSDLVPRRPPPPHENSAASFSGSTSALAAPQSLPHSLSDGRSASPSASTTKIVIPDLLADSAPAMDTKPIAPLSPGSAKASESSGTLIPEPSAYDENEPAAITGGEPDTTIRLVGGGGGVVGTVKPEEEKAEETLGGDTEDVASDAASSDSVANGAKSRKKTRGSLAGLKKLGLGLKRGSMSSLKGADSSVATS